MQIEEAYFIYCLGEMPETLELHRRGSHKNQLVLVILSTIPIYWLFLLRIFNLISVTWLIGKEAQVFFSYVLLKNAKINQPMEKSSQDLGFHLHLNMNFIHFYAKNHTL